MFIEPNSSNVLLSRGAASGDLVCFFQSQKAWLTKKLGDVNALVHIHQVQKRQKVFLTHFPHGMHHLIEQEVRKAASMRLHLLPVWGTSA